MTKPWARLVGPLIGALCLVALGWLVASQPGAVLLARALTAISSGHIVIQGVEGRLLGPLRINELTVTTADHTAQAQSVETDWLPAQLWHGRVDVRYLRAASVSVTLKDSGKPATLPDDLQWPLRVAVQEVSVGLLSVQAARLVTLSHLRGAFSSDGRMHALTSLSVDSDWGAVEASATLDGQAPFALSGSLKAGVPGQPIHLAARTAGTLGQMNVTLDARGADMVGTAQAVVTLFDALPLSQLDLALDHVNPAVLFPGAPSAALSVKAHVVPRTQPGHWALVGPVTVRNARPLAWDQGGVPVVSVRADATLAPDRLALDALQIDLAGKGRVTGEATFAGTRVDATLDLRDVDAHALHHALVSTKASGRVRVVTRGQQISATGQLSDARVAADFSARYEDGTLSVERALLKAQGAQAELAGTLSLRDARAFAVSGVVSHLDPAVLAHVPHAQLNARIKATGQLAPLSAQLQFHLQDSQVSLPTGARRLLGRGALSVTMDRVAMTDTFLEVGGNRLDANGAFGRPGDVLRFEAKLPDMAVWGAGFGGQARVAGQLTGTFTEPAGTVSVSAQALTAPGGWRAARIEAAGSVQEGRAGAMQLDARLSGLTRGDAVVLKDAQCTVAGTRQHHDLRGTAVLAEGDRLDWAAAGKLVSGLAWSGQIARFDWANAAFPLTLRAPVALDASPDEVRLGHAQLAARYAQVDLIETRWRPDGLIARGTVTGARLTHPELAASSITLGARWDVRLGAVRSGQLRLFREAGDLTVGADAPVRLGLTDARAELDLAGNRVDARIRAQGTLLGDLDGAVKFSLTPGGVQVADTQPLSGQVRVAMPSLSWLGPLLDANVHTAGAVQGQVALSGTPAAPVAAGDLRGDALAVAWVDQGLRLSDGVLRARFSERAVRLTELSFASVARAMPNEPRLSVRSLVAKPGRVWVTGDIDLSRMSGVFDWNVDRTLLLARADRWLMSSGQGRLSADRDGARFEGRLKVDASSIVFEKSRVSTVSDDVVVLGQASRPPRTFRFETDLSADLGDQFYFKAQGLDARLAGQVRLRSAPRGVLQGVGSIRVVEGVFDAYGQKLAIDRGLVNFQGPLDNPGLNVRALRRGLAVEAGVEVTGTAQNPKVRLVSEPAVPDPEKLSWIVLGRGMESGGAGADSALLLSAASAIFGTRGLEGVPQQLAQGLGLDQIRFTTSDAEGARTQTTVAGSLSGARDGGLPASVVQFGKRLSSAMYLSYEHSLTGVESVVKLTYAVSRRVSLVGRAGSDNALDLFYTLSFN